MRIWIDADACPNVIKEIIFKASARTRIPVVVVANSSIKIPINGLVSTIVVSRGFDMADDQIENSLAKGDLVITADIPLANAVITKGAKALNPRGELYSEENIKDRLATRDLMQELRDFGVVGGGPKTLGLKERQMFAGKLDALLSAYLRKNPQ
jgi:uncharacterized protein YaiI (UPF0178 family)